MNRTETEQLLRARRELTGVVWNDDTVDAWHHALTDWPYEQCRTALTLAARSEKRISVAHVTDHLPPRPTAGRRTDQHPTSCICAGRGWLEVEQIGRAGNVYLAWTRCPNGPTSAFYEID